MISGNADGLRAGEFSHAVEHAHSNGNFGRLWRVNVTSASRINATTPLKG
ncbi:MAG: hypothetical protein VB143_09170 [Burkholderia sp.]